MATASCCSHIYYCSSSPESSCENPVLTLSRFVRQALSIEYVAVMHRRRHYVAPQLITSKTYYDEEVQRVLQVQTSSTTIQPTQPRAPPSALSPYRGCSKSCGNSDPRTTTETELLADETGGRAAIESSASIAFDALLLRSYHHHAATLEKINRQSILLRSQQDLMKEEENDDGTDAGGDRDEIVNRTASTSREKSPTKNCSPTARIIKKMYRESAAREVQLVKEERTEDEWRWHLAKLAKEALGIVDHINGISSTHNSPERASNQPQIADNIAWSPNRAVGNEETTSVTANRNHYHQHQAENRHLSSICVAALGISDQFPYFPTKSRLL